LRECSERPGDVWEQLALISIGKAQSLEKGATQKERDLIQVLATYLKNPEDNNREATYLTTVRSLLKKYPLDPDVTSIQALSSMHMQGHQTTTEGNQKQAQSSADLVGEALKEHPQHPGLLHFHIHALEDAGKPADALNSANTLNNLVPGSGHLQHMPAHIYADIGRYHDASEANLRGIQADYTLFKEGGIQVPGFSGFYLHTQFYVFQSLSMEGRYKDALAEAKDVANRLKTGELISDKYYLDVFSAVPYLIITRFGNWSQAAKEPAPDISLPYTTGTWLYMQGMANVQQGNVKEAESIYKQYKEWIAKYQRETKDYNPTLIQLLCLGCLELEGQIAAANGNTKQQLNCLKAAVRVEDGLSMHMTPWYMPLRQCLAAALIKDGQWAEAEKVLRQDLKTNPNNGWSLFGLTQVLEHQHKTDELQKTKAKFESAWHNADWKITSVRL
jgi:tetratricopeptide (TPR) repeat protein